MTDYQLLKQQNIFKIVFNAMANACEILLYTQNKKLAQQIAQLSIAETRRIENKFSRYQKNNLCWKMNHSHGKAVSIDQETALLLTYSQQLFELSEGLFDITSGVLRKIWQFKAGMKPPSQAQINELLPYIGFNQIQFNQQSFTLPKSMQIDFGGVGKEYCVDAVSKIIEPICSQEKVSYLVNFGGDLIAKNYNQDHPAWIVGLENVVEGKKAQAIIEVSQGAIATSGSTKNVFEYKGKSYAHILNPKTGYPIEGAPRSVSVFAQTCSLAGGMSTLAQLQGAQAETFLQNNNIKHICCW